MFVKVKNKKTKNEYKKLLIIIAIILVVLVISKLSGKPTPPKPGGWDVNPHNPKNGQKQRNRESEDW